MQLTTLITYFTTYPCDVVNVKTVEVLSYTGITSITVNETEYENPNRVCLMTTDNRIEMKITQYNSKKITSIPIADIETITIEPC